VEKSVKRIYSILSVLVLAVGLSLGTVGVAGADMTPTETLEEGIDKIVAVLKDPKVNTESGKREAIEELSEMAGNYFAFDELTKRAVGKPWLDMSEGQRTEFVQTFRKLLELTYLQKIRQYHDEKVEFTKELVKGNRAMVLTNVQAKDSVYSVNYKLIKRENRWLVYDVIGENISLVKNYRQQFNEILQKSSLEELVERLKKKVSALESGKVADPE